MVFSVLTLPGGDPVGDQGLQLDGHALQGLDLVRTRRCSTRSASSALFTIGGLTGLFLATLGLDVHVHDTYFVVAHFHYIMVGGAIMGYLGGLHFWWPKMTGRMYSECWARLSAVLIFIGFNLTFFPQFMLGYLGMPRRYHAYPDEFQVLNVMSTAGAIDPRRRLPASRRLPRLVAASGRAGRREPLGGHGPRVEDAVAAADRELPRASRW